MSKILLSGLACFALLQGADSTQDILKNGKVYGNIKYYYIQTDKQNNTPHKDSSANANAIGGTFGVQTGKYYGFSGQATFMTTNGFGLSGAVDTSVLGRDNGVRLDSGNPSGSIAQDSFSVLGEEFIGYSYKKFYINYGRQILKTPLVNAKEVRMLPSSMEGLKISYRTKDDHLSFGGKYLTHFKQRTSSQFMNIIEHALGTHTEEVIGDEKGSMCIANINYNNHNLSTSIYDYYAANFMNSLFANILYKGNTNSYVYHLGLEGIVQKSIGNADINLQKSDSITGGKKINAASISVKSDIQYHESKFMLGYSHISSDDSAHDSLVLPWDGTPLYTNMITSNDLFVSNYGKSLIADSIYIGGTQSFKIAYTQGYDFTGKKGFKSTLSYMVADNDRFLKGKQKDFNIVLAYRHNKHFSVVLKGIFVTNNTSAEEDGTIKQLDDFQQYRVIANYVF
ncbi:MAG: OprD family porin [Sulfurovum sp.]|nr:OprD family porin [Sulfurovum sp.]